MRVNIFFLYLNVHYFCLENADNIQTIQIIQEFIAIIYILAYFAILFPGEMYMYVRCLLINPSIPVPTIFSITWFWLMPNSDLLVR